MDTVKHQAYHHLHQASPPTNLGTHHAHNSLSSNANTVSSNGSQPFAFGSNPSQGQQANSIAPTSKLNFENSTAFPLLLSSISSESGGVLPAGVGGGGVGGGSVGAVAGRTNAFPSPKSGVSSFSRGSSGKASSSSSSSSYASLSSTVSHNASANLNLLSSASGSHLSHHHQSGNALAQQFTSAQLGAGKHKQSTPDHFSHFNSTSNITIHHPHHQLIPNGVVKGPSKGKSAPTHTQVAPICSNRQQASTFGPSATNGSRGQQQQLHLQQQQYLTDAAGTALIGATSASSALPYQKNLYARETPLNNNGTSSNGRSRASPNKENNKGNSLSSGAPSLSLAGTALPAAALPSPITAAPAAAAVSTAGRRATRSPTRAPGPKSSVNNNNNGSKSNSNMSSSSANHQNHQHINLHNHVLVNGTASPSPQLLDLSLETINFVASNHNGALSPSAFIPKPKPKEFKFFKEKEKAKEKQKHSAAGCTNNGCKEATGQQQQQQQHSSAKSTSKSTTGKVKSATTSSSSGGTVKKGNKGSTTKADKPSTGLLGRTKGNHNSSSSNSEVTKGSNSSGRQSTSTSLPVSSEEVGSTFFPRMHSGAFERAPHVCETPMSERIVYFSESIIDGFAIQCFTDQESLEVSNH